MPPSACFSSTLFCSSSQGLVDDVGGLDKAVEVSRSNSSNMCWRQNMYRMNFSVLAKELSLRSTRF